MTMYIEGVNYLNQTDSFRCGVIAIINTLKYCKVDLTRDATKWLDFLTDCDCTEEKRGVWPKDLFFVLKMFSILTNKFSIRKVKYNKDIFDKPGKCFLVDHFTGFDEDERMHSHYILIVPDGDNYKIVNPTDAKRTAINLSNRYKKRFIHKFFKRGQYGLKHNLPLVWEIKRK